MTSDLRTATVYIFLPGQGYVPCGLLTSHVSRRYSLFGYGRRYRERPDALPVDPVLLPLSLAGEIRTPPRHEMFSALRDAAPDRWGRKVLALASGVDLHDMSEFDVLTCYHSPHRIGALAFGPETPKEGPRSLALWAPKDEVFLRSLTDLERIMETIEKIERTGDEEDLDRLRGELSADILRQALTSIFSVGGARPKCLCRLDNTFWIAKFPKGDDDWNEPLIEHGAMLLARACGIRTAETRILRIRDRDVLLVERFDRTRESAEPRHLVSALTLVGRLDDEDWGSYQSLVELARKYGDPEAGPELFRRMIFNILCSNTDDHLRNQAFFVERTRLLLTPAYDITPQRHQNSIMALRCGKLGAQPSLENALSETLPFGLRQAEAEKIVEEMLLVLRGWKESFQEIGLGENDVTKLERCFKV